MDAAFPEMIQKAIVKTVTFHNPENGYSVLRLTDPVTKKQFTAVGCFPKLSPGENLEIEGEWARHDVFGEQLKAKGYKLLPPDSQEAMERYLGGGVLKGVGPGLAKRLVARFGLETFEVLDNHPERLSEVSRLTGKSKAALLAGWQDNKSMREVLYFLQAHNLSANLSARIFKEYGASSVHQLRANPYRLANEMWGVGFLKADEVARKLGFGLDSYERIEAGVEYALAKSAEEGHVFLHRHELKQRAQALLQCEPEKSSSPWTHWPKAAEAKCAMTTRPGFSSLTSSTANAVSPGARRNSPFRPSQSPLRSSLRPSRERRRPSGKISSTANSSATASATPSAAESFS